MSIHAATAKTATRATMTVMRIGDMAYSLSTRGNGRAPIVRLDAQTV